MASMTVSYYTISLLIPEILLVIVAAWIYVAGAFVENRVNMTWAAVVGFVAAGYGLFAQLVSAQELYEAGIVGAISGPLEFDLLGYLLRCMAVLIGLLLVAMMAGSQRNGPAPEILGSLLLVFAGLMLVCAAGELVLLFLGLELISIPTYVLLFLGRRDQSSREATFKYFFLSILSSALLLYGFSFLYGLGGSTRLEVIAARLSSPEVTPPAILAALALLLIFAGLAFKIAAVPFHFYAPDVYQGTTNSNAGLLAVVPKIAGVVAIVRVGAAIAPTSADLGWQVCLVLALLTMTVGNVLALWQSNLRRLMAYSSIAHAGYMLIGLGVWMVSLSTGAAAEATSGLAATLLYLTIYVAATIGTFAVLVYLGREEKQVETVDEISGLCRTRPIAALALAVFMFSLAGIPPLAGFWGKFALFASALSVSSTEPGLAGLSIRWWFVLLAVVGVINAAISAAYYLRVVATMYFASPQGTPRAEGGFGAAWAASFCTVLVIGLGVYPGPLFSGSNIAARAAVIPPMVEVEERSPEEEKAAATEVNNGVASVIRYRR